MRKIVFYIFMISFFAVSCEKDLEEDEPILLENDKNPQKPTPYPLQLPPHFSLIVPPNIPEDNPLTYEGVELGRKLFYEKMLSGNNTLSCGSCHKPEHAFSDLGKNFSLGIHGQMGIRNAMPLFNVAFANQFNWHGSVNSLENQAFEPVTNPLEMVEVWDNATKELQAHPDYPKMFESAFGTGIIDSNLVVKAISQFQRTLISGNSKVDNYIKEKVGIPISGPSLNAKEKRGLQIYMAEDKGDCFHCHGDLNNPLFTDNHFRNNGLDMIPKDSGLASVTGKASDLGKFKTPSIRNLVYTAPYMHDGRFTTLDDVLDFYTNDVQNSPYTDPLMLKSERSLTVNEKDDLKAFLMALTDSTFINNPAFQDPNQ